MLEPDSLLQILTSLKSKGSGTGISYYLQKCPRKALLDQKFGGEESSFDALVGTVFHKLEELYFTGQLSSIALPLNDGDPGIFKVDPVQEALRVFSVYVKLFPKDEFHTVACELQLPRNDLEAKIAELTVGIAPFTMRADRVIDVTEEQIPGILERRRVQLKPGRYLVDTKTSSAKDSQAVYKHALSLQFIAYQRVYAAIFDQTPLNGMLVNSVIRHQKLEEKEPDGSWRSFKTYLIDPPTPAQAMALSTYLPRQKRRLESGECELTACFDYGRPCHQYLNGNCNRV